MVGFFVPAVFFTAILIRHKTITDRASID